MQQTQDAAPAPGAGVESGAGASGTAPPPRDSSFVRAFLASVLGTGLSRVLGAVRDIVVARLLGAGAGSDAFWIAFTVPNVFRRFVADEGLTGAIFVPFGYNERIYQKLDLAKRYDLSFVTVEVLDRSGMLHPNADNEVRFSLTGPGRIVGVGNGDPASLESFQEPRRKAYNGRCQVVICSQERPGRIVLQARAQGLRAARVEIRTTAARSRA